MSFEAAAICSVVMPSAFLGFKISAPLSVRSLKILRSDLELRLAAHTKGVQPSSFESSFTISEKNGSF